MAEEVKGELDDNSGGVAVIVVAVKDALLTVVLVREFVEKVIAAKSAFEELLFVIADVLDEELGRSSLMLLLLLLSVETGGEI